MSGLNPPHPHPPVWFPDWADALHQLRLPAGIRLQYRTALIQYLRFCKQAHQRATVDSARQFMESVHAKRMLGVSMLATWKEALNWFFTEGRKPPPVGTALRAVRFGERHGALGERALPGNTITDVPTLGAADLGKTEWEQKLVRELRMRHYQWRTEQTYRQWAWRFAFPSALLSP